MLAAYLFLILLANGAPVIAREFFSGSIGERAIDNGLMFVDGRPLFGTSKTWRGLTAGIILPGLIAPLLGISFLDGFLIGALAMTGDLLGSFIKRRLNVSNHRMLPVVDQVPEALLPLTYGYWVNHLTHTELLWGIIIFFIIEICLSLVFYILGLRKKPL